MNPHDPPSDQPTSRRKFFTRSAQAAALFTVGGHASISTAATPFTPLPSKKALDPIKLDANQVRDIATGPQDHIYIAADSAIHILNSAGSPIKSIPLAAPPHCLAIHRDGRIVAGFKNHIQVLNPDGSLATSGPPLKGNPSLTSIALHPTGEIFASDSGNQVIWHLDASGKALHKIDRNGKGFAVPKNFFPIALTPNGQLSAVNVGRHRIETFDPDGTPVAAWGEKSRDLHGFGGCCNPVAFALTSTGQVVTAEAGLPRIKIFDAQGSFQSLVAGPDAFETNARESRERPEQLAACHTGGFEITVDSKDRILVLDRVAAELHIFA
jgi:hypothetical protein